MFVRWQSRKRRSAAYGRSSALWSLPDAPYSLGLFLLAASWWKDSSVVAYTGTFVLGSAWLEV
jgi:hypothetical protein